MISITVSEPALRINQFEVNQFNETLVGIIIDDETFTASNYGVGVDVDFENKAMFIEHLYSKSSHQALIAFRTSNSDFTKTKMRGMLNTVIESIQI